jgi:hypothetical protein
MILDQIVENYPDEEILKADGLDDGIIGIEESSMRLVYSKSKVIEILMNEDMTEEDALEHYYYNIVGAYVGEKTPIFVEDKSFMDFFNLTDTLINGIHLNFVNSKKDIIDRYFLKKDNREFLYANISYHLVTKTNIIVKFNYSTFKCDKWFFKNLPLILKSNGFTQIEKNGVDLQDYEAFVNSIKF